MPLAGIRRKTGGVSESSWYDPQPVRRRHHVRRRDVVEFAIAVLLLAGLLGLLVVGVARDEPGTPGPAASSPP
jgi:hypothetical protein